jgi:microcystin-dependent protein
VILEFGGSTAPTGYLLCNGASLLRAGTYAALFAVIGTSYGAVDGTHFNVPDHRDRFPVGAGTTYAAGSTGGLASVALTTAEAPVHSHGLNSHVHGLNSHVHTITHTHTMAHTHSLQNHAHTMAHSHTPNAIANFITDGGAYGLQAGGDLFVQAVGSTAGSSAVNTGGPSFSDVGGASVSTTSAASATDSGAATGNTAAASGSTANEGSGAAHENRPPYIGVYYIIKT